MSGTAASNQAVIEASEGQFTSAASDSFDGTDVTVAVRAFAPLPFLPFLPGPENQSRTVNKTTV